MRASEEENGVAVSSGEEIFLFRDGEMTFVRGGKVAEWSFHNWVEPNDFSSPEGLLLSRVCFLKPYVTDCGFGLRPSFSRMVRYSFHFSERRMDGFGCCIVRVVVGGIVCCGKKNRGSIIFFASKLSSMTRPSSSSSCDEPLLPSASKFLAGRGAAFCLLVAGEILTPRADE